MNDVKVVSVSIAFHALMMAICARVAWVQDAHAGAMILMIIAIASAGFAFTMWREVSR